MRKESSDFNIHEAGDPVSRFHYWSDDFEFDHAFKFCLDFLTKLDRCSSWRMYGWFSVLLEYETVLAWKFTNTTKTIGIFVDDLFE